MAEKDTALNTSDTTQHAVTNSGTPVEDARRKGKKLDAQIPYLAAPGTIKTALPRIQAASTPDRVTGDFVSTKLQIRGGQGAALAAYLKKIGLVAPDGTPTELYKKFRNPATGGAAIAAAIKIGYKALAGINEYFYELDDTKLRGVVVQATGAEADSSATRMIVATLKNLKSFADFEASTNENEALVPTSTPNSTKSESNFDSHTRDSAVGLNLAYTINLNLPATSDQAVFNAIFKSLKEHLLANE